MSQQFYTLEINKAKIENIQEEANLQFYEAEYSPFRNFLNMHTQNKQQHMDNIIKNWNFIPQ